jgi:hypothetical protein
MPYNLNHSALTAHGCSGMQPAKMLAKDTSVVFKAKLELRTWRATVISQIFLPQSLLQM